MVSKDVWQPNTKISHTKKQEEEVINDPLRILFKPGYQKTKLFTRRISLVTIWCNTTYLDEYPFDHYECNFEYQNSDGNGPDKVNLISKSHKLNKEIKSEEFNVVCGKVKSSNQVKKGKEYSVSISY